MSKVQTTKITIIVFSLVLSLVSNLPFASAQNLDEISDYSIKLAITPSHIEQGASEHHVGYLYVLGKSGIPITSSYDVSIQLSSNNPQIASVPEMVVFKANEEYATFDVTSGTMTGDTFITATLNSKTDFQQIQVGNAETHLPDDLILELNIPTENMHVNSAMPFSVYLRTSDGNVIRAPFDIDVNLEYEKSLASPASDVLTIKKGDYYAWSTFETHDKVGNTFLRAIQTESGLDTAKSIKISSTLPTSLKINVFPKLVAADVNKNVDIFVSVVDSDGNPTITPKDIPLNLFSDNQYPVGEKLDDTMKESKTVIKKGQFGYYLQVKLNLYNVIKNDIMIGASAEGYGVASDTFSTVGKPMSIDDKKITKTDTTSVKDTETKNEIITKKDIKLFVPDRIPGNATAIVTYQLSAIETDDDDPEETDDATTNQNQSDENKLIYSIDDLEDGEFYPIQSNENYYADGYVTKLDVISGDNAMVAVKDIGKIESTYSFGTATISTGQKSGPVLISASVQGVGSDSQLTEVVNTLEQKEARIFSPTGEKSILFDREGNFDVFLIAIDAEDRPKVLKHDSKYLITPTNGLMEIKKDNTFTFATLHSDSFTITEEENSVVLKATPIGENTDLSLASEKTFVTQPSSKLQVVLPQDEINANYEHNFGIIQIVDLQGNPIIPAFDVKSKIVSSNEGVIEAVDDAVIPSGLSYTTFPIKTTGVEGSSVISASAKGVIGTNHEVSTSALATKLKISTTGLVDKLKPNEELEIKLFVDDDSAESVSGAIVKIETDGNSLVNPGVIRTGSDGSAVFSLTATNGPTTSINFIANAEGYTEAKDSLLVNVDAPTKSGSFANLNLPEWIVYVIFAVILVMVVMVILFLKKSKVKVTEDWEEEEI
ncbi:MAG: hypothetical protein HW410_1255 [Nitrosarchaeum sp.]|nr:hypothetical protein [Nitrosarchaeum sp.]